MIKKIKGYLLIMLLVLGIGAPALIPATAGAAACKGVSNSIADGADAATGANDPGSTTKKIDCEKVGTDEDPSSLGKIGKMIVNIFSIIVGIAAIIMIVYSGFRYITSGGDSARVTSAKNTLIYALVGIVVAALAQLIVRFVLSQTKAVGG